MTKDLPSGDIVFFDGRGDAVEGYSAQRVREILEAALKPGEPKCVAIIEVFGRDWKLEYLSLPVGRHKLYDQHYTYAEPPAQTPAQGRRFITYACPVCAASLEVQE